MKYRNCQESDIAACAKILSDVYALPPYDEQWELKHAVEYLLRFYTFDPALCFVATDGEMIIGAIFSYSYPWHGGENCYIQEIFVNPASQGNSVGAGLINKLSVSKKGNSTWLVANENAKAIEFYKSLGFSNNGPYKFFHGAV